MSANGFSERVYGWLLRAYPQGFRALYAHDMMLDFRDGYRAALAGNDRWGGVGFWTNILLDLITSATNERLRNVPYRRSTEMIDTTQFNNQLASTLDFWSRMMRGGYSVKQVFELLAENAPEPTAGFILDTLKDAEESGDFAGAIARMTERLDSPYLQQVIQAVLKQRETGGNLADVLDDVNSGMRDDISGENWAESYDYNDGK